MSLLAVLPETCQLSKRKRGKENTTNEHPSVCLSLSIISLLHDRPSGNSSIRLTVRLLRTALSSLLSTHHGVPAAG